MFELLIQTLMRKIIAVLGVAALIYSVFIGGTLVAYGYVSWHMEWIVGRDLDRSTIEANKGLLASKEVGRDYIEPFFEYGMLPQMDGVENETIVTYSFLTFYFTIAYDSTGQVLVVLDNGL